jgi:hypothetical protein
MSIAQRYLRTTIRNTDAIAPRNSVRYPVMVIQ